METEIQKENEEKKEYLKSYRRAVKREKDILDEIQRLRADNNQIVDGIRAGVYEAMVNALESFSGGGNGQNTEVKVYLEGDSKKLFKVIRTEGQDYQKSTGKPVFE